MKIYSNFFFVHPFLASKINNNTFITESNIFSRYRLSNGQPISNFENLQNFA